MKKSKGRLTNHLGIHVLGEFYGCSTLNDSKFVLRALKKAAILAGAKIVAAKIYKFAPFGVTGFVLLAESHISIHTWPEYKFCAVDIFTCGANMEPEKAMEFLRKTLGAKRVSIHKFRRGLF